MSEKKYTTETVNNTIKVVFNGTTLVESKHALLLKEGSHAPVYYFPRTDAKMEHLQPSEHQTHWPHKGDASYFSITVGDQIAEDAVWSYETPVTSASEIQDLIAFYAEHVDFIES